MVIGGSVDLQERPTMSLVFFRSVSLVLQE